MGIEIVVHCTKGNEILKFQGTVGVGIIQVMMIGEIEKGTNASACRYHSLATSRGQCVA